jgi:hypothetical protein
MIMNFEVGQKVLCVNDHFGSYCAYPVFKDDIYTIHDLYQCPCGSRQVTLEEVPGRTVMGCKCTRTSERRQSYYDWRFIPLTYFECLLEPSVSKRKPEKYHEINRYKYYYPVGRYPADSQYSGWKQAGNAAVLQGSSRSYPFTG